MKNAVATVLIALGALAAVLWAAQWGFKNPLFNTNQSTDPGSETAVDQSANNPIEATQSPNNSQQVALLEPGIENLAAINFSTLPRTSAQRAQSQSTNTTGLADDTTNPAAAQRRPSPVRASW
ncbi:MAG: hypothetical protein KME16_23235 [Scytolyngbya sp. HA4215-MV1]|jgi:Rieske Fe-S protein|nr:hypothetical protein [Scytolyngbya sp. HA4215-MV1]